MKPSELTPLTALVRHSVKQSLQMLCMTHSSQKLSELVKEAGYGVVASALTFSHIDSQIPSGGTQHHSIFGICWGRGIGRS